MTKLELLSPAKNLECGMEAINHGADAVYIGASRYGARAAAGNSVEDISRLCTYAHQYNAKVFVTVNTIIYDEELHDTIALVKELDAVGVDAILVQDMGLMQELGNISQGDHAMSLHASTQTDNRTVEKVRWLHDMGFRRVVLARELSVSEIREIHRQVPDVELEVFVHGALCVSYSGQCYASQHCFGRSANRGECAQFCRMPFTLRDANGNVLEENIHLLSLKDMSQLDNIERLAEAGAVSFKIEGRLKDVDYVKNVTAAYSERLNELCRKHPERYQRASMGRCTYTFEPDIKKSFNRGFTTYFADYDADKSIKQSGLVSFDTPKAIGEPVGRVKELRGNSFNVSSTASFCNGDGLCFFDKDRRLIGFRVNRAEGNRLFPLSMPRELKPGTMLYRNLDHAFQTLLSKPSAERKVEVTMQLRITQDALQLTVTDEHGSTASATLPYEYQMAQKPQEENICRQLSKLGGTIYTCTSLTVDTTLKQPFIPSSQLANLRREALSSAWNKPATTGNQSVVDNSSVAVPDNSLPLYQGKRGENLSYLYNASNRTAKEYYAAHGVADARSFEKEGGVEDNLLMQCRYCLRAEMGYCTKSGRRAPWKEPLSISLDDGKTFLLRFNCDKCQMEVVCK